MADTEIGIACESAEHPRQVAPVRVGRYTRLRPISPNDYGWLYDVAVQSDAGSRWRLHGHVPDFDQFIGGTLARAAATFVIERIDGPAVGMVQLWNLEQLSRHAQVTALLPEEFQGAGWPLEGVALCVDYGFRAFDLRKIYLETLSSELATFRSLLGGLLQEEGRLRGHQFVFGEFVDLHVIAIYREGFDAVFQQLLPAGVS